MGRPRPYSLSAIALALVVGVAACSSAAAPPSPLSRGAVVVASAELSDALASPTPSLPTAAASPTTPASIQPSTLAPSPAATPGSWTLDLYDARAVRWQNPMCRVHRCLRFDDAQHGGLLAGLRSIGRPCAGAVAPRGWKPDITLARQKSILATSGRRDDVVVVAGCGRSRLAQLPQLLRLGQHQRRRLRRPVVHLVRRRRRATVTAIALYRKPSDPEHGGESRPDRHRL